jgi:hypothetical protein
MLGGMICDSVKGWRREKRGVDDKGVEELGTKVDGGRGGYLWKDENEIPQASDR